jgi:predicted hotdog family 3-hydroxylacyl-ACP dehydratase
MESCVEPAILRVVPHRAPILRLERVISATRSEAVVAGREPTGPGALPWELGAIEGLAQAAAVLLAQAFLAHELPADPRGMLVAVKRFAVHAHPPAGATVHYRVQLVRRFGPTTLISGHAECDGERLAGGDLTLWSDQAR